MKTTRNFPKTLLPLCVDLDGTLLKTDSLWEGLTKLLFVNPFLVLKALVILLRGRAEFKEYIASASDLDAATLPLNEKILEFVSDAAEGGHDVYLVTGAPERVATTVATKIGIFKGVTATTEASGNLTSNRKAKFLVENFGDKNFDYIGDSGKDLPVWSHARNAYGADIAKRTRHKAEAANFELIELSYSSRSFRSWAKLLRVHQALKNILIFIPLLLAHQLFDVGAFLDALVAFMAFTAVSYGSYVWNDLHDLATDRAHPTKRNRPLASGAIPIPHALLISLTLVIGGVALSTLVNLALTSVLVIYLVVTVAYSAFVKTIAVADVIVLAGLYTLRIIAGAIAISAPISIWVMLTSVFMFFSLALMKRHSEFVKYESETLAGRGYRLSDKFAILSAGLSSSLMAVLVVGLYIDSRAVSQMYSSPVILWAILPLLLFWSTRLWFLTERGEMDDDPIAFTITDRVSQVIAFLLVLVVAAAAYIKI